MARAQRLIGRPLALRRWLVCSSSVVLKSPAVTYLPLHDQFSDADAVDLAAHAIAPANPGGLSWSKVGTSDAAIYSNKAKTSGVYGVYVLDPKTPEVQLSGKFTPVTSGDGYIGLVARFEDMTHLWQIAIDVATDKLRITEVNTSSTVRAAATITLEPDTEYLIEASLAGATISAAVGGGSSISYASATFQQTKTKHGVILRYAGDLADDFQMEAA